MIKKLYYFILLIIMGSQISVAYSASQYKENDIIYINQSTTRKIIKITDNGYLVQDFALKHKYTSPFLIIDPQEITYPLHWADFLRENKNKSVQSIDGPIIIFQYASDKKNFEGYLKKGLIDGQVIIWETNGTKIEFYTKNGKIDGPRRSWYSNGKIAYESSYENELGRNGLFTSWDTDGRKRSESQYTNNQLNGLVKTWSHKDYLEKEEHYKNGQRHGLQKTWYPNGQLKTQSNWVEGKQEGIESLWYKNGKKWRDTFYTNGVKNGTETFWLQNGQKSKERYYISGVESK